MPAVSRSTLRSWKITSSLSRGELAIDVHAIHTGGERMLDGVQAVVGSVDAEPTVREDERARRQGDEPARSSRVRSRRRRRPRQTNAASSDAGDGASL